MKKDRRYPPEYRRRLVDLVRAGRTIVSLANEYGVSYSAIRKWVMDADAAAMRNLDGVAPGDQTELLRLRERVAELEEEREILKKAFGLVRPGSDSYALEAFGFVKAHQAVHAISTMCRVLEVSRSGYYAWLHRGPSERAKQDAKLTVEIHRSFEASRGTYGAPRVLVDLADAGYAVGKKRVARLMRCAGLEGVTRRRKRPTTVRDPQARPAKDLVDRDFSASGPNELWVADITYVPTLAGHLYLAVVLDAWSRRIVGWSMRDHLHTELVIDALDMAVAQRQPTRVIHHSDQGCQYTSLAFGARCGEWGVQPSMGSVGDAYDNAMCESFFATLECELIDRVRFRNHAEADAALFDFIEGFYNTKRRHSALDYLPPARYERTHAQAA
ncbi:MAG: IS3 family transposase [Myxococcales bacterium]|nr:IS3 family transposase [Myxococcales bacterium]